MKKRGVILSLLAISLMLSAIALAAFTRSSSDSSIDAKYYSNEDLRGSLRIKFNNELAGNRFTGVFTKSGRIVEKEGKTLKEVLDEAEVKYTCSPSTCQDSYSLSTGEASKSISIPADAKKLLALKLTGTSIVFESLTFNIDINNSKTCKNPMQIDLFDDGIIDFEAWNMTEDYSCSMTLGCFNLSSGSFETMTINPSGTPYCEKVILPASNKIRLGAKVTKGTSEGDLKMALYSTNGEWLNDCDLPEPTSATEEDVSCNLEYPYSETEEFYACISSEGGNYKIKSETKNPCGFASGPEDFDGEYTNDYYIFAATPRYENIGAITEANFEALSYGEIENYLLENYDNNCRTGCSIPIKFISNSESSVDVYNLSLIYGKKGGTVDDNNIYDAVKNPLKLTVGNYSMLQIENFGIKVPETAGTYSLDLNLGDEEIMSKDITVEKVQVIKFLYPRFVAYKTSTTFGLITDQSVAITKYEWDFGDTQTEETTIGFASHSYLESGAYSLKVTASTALGRSFSQEFNITVASARDSVNITIEEYQKMINNVSFEILKLPAWSQNLVKEMMGLSNLTSQLINAKQKFRQAANDADYTNILDTLLAMKVPNRITAISTGELPYYFNYNEIDKSKLTALGAGETANIEKLGGWVFANENLMLGFKFLEIQYSNEQENFGIITLKIAPKEGKDVENYIVIDGNVQFKQDYGQKEADGSYGIMFNDLAQREVEFLQYNANKFTDVKIYASPAFDELLETGGVCDYDETCEPEESESWRNCSDCKPWGIALWVFLGVLIISGVAGYFVWKWYQNEYENRLFKDKSKLYNLMSFVKTSKAQRLSKGEIYAKLRKEGWNGEQIEYAMMQLEGSIWAKIFFRRSTIERLESLGLPVCLKD